MSSTLASMMIVIYPMAFIVVTGLYMYATRHSRVQVYDGFVEEAKRIVFNYGRVFPPLKRLPTLHTLVVRDGVPTIETTKALERTPHGSVVTFAQPHTVECVDGWPRELRGVYFFSVADDETPPYAHVQMWYTKCDAEFEKSCSWCTSSAEQGKVSLVALTRARRALARLFDIEEYRVRLKLCTVVRRNTKRVYVGHTEDLIEFLRDSPRLQDDLNILSLEADGFTALVIRTDGTTSERAFKMTPRVRYALYTNQWGDIVTSCMRLQQFQEERRLL